MKASVIIANYNNAKFVKDCLNSLISQTYKNVEIIFLMTIRLMNQLRLLRNMKI